ncbi:neprilysin-2-like [Microplitis mediator]|uniref:neprilysin-2-like n=1 Tax=Microplitis mediator TaxID=375433 RepID=UPI0025542D49|nr:neprilysin-2-like [Microplitis mediator]
MKKLWVNWLLLFISMATAEKSNDAIGNLTGNELNCTTRECVRDNLEFELTMLNNMNASVNPCDDFYEFACGNFDNVPDDMVQGTEHNTFLHAFSDIFQKMYNLIVKSGSSESFQPFNFLNDFLISCDRVNINNVATYSGIKKDNLDYLNEIISKFGGWPVVKGDKWNETDDNWTNFIDEAKSTDFIYYHFYGLRSRSVNNYTIISFQPMDLEFSRENGKKPTHSSNIAYRDFMVNVSDILGANKTQAKIELASLLLFEKRLTFISEKNSTSRSSNDSLPGFSVKRVIENWPSIDWIKLLNTQSDLPSNVTNGTIIYIDNTDQVTYLDYLVNVTPAKVRANYAMWKTIQKLIPMVESPSLSQSLHIYNKIKNPSYVDEPVNCWIELTERFPELLLAYYGRKYPVEGLAKVQIHQLISYIEQQFYNTLNSTKWLDVKARDTLFETINSLKFIIGYPEEIMDDRKLEEYFQGLNITNDNFLKNVINRKIFTKKKVFNFYHKPQNSIGFLDYFHNLILFNADTFFNSHTNKIVLGIELLRNLYFSIYRPNYFNIAVLGYKLAHEIGHSIDITYKNDINSKVNNSKWTESSKQVYRDVRECTAQQYSNYSRKMNGEFYLDENIVDNIGVKVAYSAYQDWVKTHGPQPTFSSLPYNSNQLFWLSFANLWCTPKSKLQNWRPTNVHPPHDHRVIMPLFNSPEFSKDFNCPLGSNMNPIKKCIVF